MKLTNIIFTIAGIIAPAIAMAEIPFIGIYQTIDDNTNKPKSIVALYEHQDKLTGRIVALYDENGNISETTLNATRIAEKVDGTPTYVGLDIIWNMEWDDKDDEYTNGKIMDPATGKIYSSVIWQDSDKSKLRVRGKIGPFGRTQTWHVLSTADMPDELQKIDTNTWSPVIRK